MSLQQCPIAPYPTRTCCKCSGDLGFVSHSNLPACDVCRYYLFGGKCPPGAVPNDYVLKQEEEYIPHVLPVEKWPEIRYELPRGASRYKRTIDYFRQVEKQLSTRRLNRMVLRSAA